MAHPYHHAVSSARKWGGVPADYQKIHDWFDQSKMIWADVRHRALRHHVRGLYDAVDRFGHTIINRDGLDVPVYEIGAQHVMEDCGEVPGVDEWLGSLQVQPWMDLERCGVPHDNHGSRHAQVSADKWGGLPADYAPIHGWFDELPYGLGNRNLNALRHHAAGIFDAEAAFGTTITNSRGRAIPVRWIGEQHVKADFGRIPTMQDWFKHIPMKVWMGEPPVKLEAALEQQAAVATGKVT